ncbi:MAG TPA: PEP/pyruvate-binding domain-containing protein [Polyangiaceae bacterium]|nr:PEP/pyruvate-binding domain-containing protein [Polyangiaceae bacterium]
MRWSKFVGSLALFCTPLLGACSSESPAAPAVELNWPCELPAGATGDSVPDFVTKTGCVSDFQAIASQPLDASIPGARSGKVVLDLRRGNQLYFQNSARYQIHYEFVSHSTGVTAEQLYVGSLDSFNPQYTQPLDQRLFLLGAVTYYEQPKVWALEIAPYDTATPAMIEQLYNAVKEKAYYGPVLKFHPTSENVEATAKNAKVPVVTTDDLYAAIDYQPLNLGEAVGTLKILHADQLANEYVSIKDIVVLDAVPNDISPVAAIVTEEFQTPLSHINVLARNRHTPNMGLRHATTNAKIAPHAGKPVRITVGSNGWDVEPVTQAEADAWFEAHKPAPVTVPAPDLTVKDLRDINTVTVHTDTPPYVTFDQIKTATRQFGAKAANYSVFATDTGGKVPHKPAFAIPVYFYNQFMVDNKIFSQVDMLRQDPTFESDDVKREAALLDLRNQILVGKFSDEFQTALKAKLDKDFPGKAMRFRSSTNAEDLDGFPCAGCYDSHTGDPAEFAGDQMAACLQAIRKTWATVWNKRTYDERMIHSIDHDQVAMALLVHTNFPDEEANGVAITNNIFDSTGNAPGFYVNVQYGGLFEVVHPPAGITSDSFLYMPTSQTTIYYTHSNHPAPYVGPTVLTDRQIYDLGIALAELHTRFSNAYQTDPNAWYAIDSEFKFDDDADKSKPPTLYIKQARPYPASDSVSTGD